MSYWNARVALLVGLVNAAVSAGSRGPRTPTRLARVGFVCIPVCGVFRRIRSRRGGGGVERGGDACIAQPGKRAPTRGDASIPTPLHTAPAPTRSDASEDAAHGDSYKTYPCKPLWSPPRSTPPPPLRNPILRGQTRYL